MTSLPLRSFRTPGGATIAVSPLGFGTAPLGNLYAAIPEADAQATLAAAWDAGCRLFDTAPLYGFGLAETRLNHFLRGRKRESFALSTKVGRLLRLTPPETLAGRIHFFDTPSRAVVFDYSYDGVMRSVEDSLERLGADQFDILFAHDLGADTHGSRAASDEKLREFLDGGMRALDELRRAGVVKAVGAGCNEWEVCEALARAADVDVFLLAGRYTLLEQEALTSFLPLCQARGIGIVVGGPFNSGILVGGTHYNYVPAPPEILARVARIKAVCTAHGVGVASAALRFPLAHPAVISVIPGAVTPDEVRRNIEAFAAPIPDALWHDLAREELIRADAPLP